MWYARRHKQDITAGGGYGSEAKKMDRLRIQLRKTRNGLVNPLKDVNEALRERRGDMDLGDFIQVLPDGGLRPIKERDPKEGANVLHQL